MRLLRTNSSKTSFEESLVKFKQHLRIRGYPKTVIERSLSGVNFAHRPSALTQKKKAKERILPFVTTYHPAVNNLKQTLMEQWSLIPNQPLLKTIYLKPTIISSSLTGQLLYSNDFSNTYYHPVASHIQRKNPVFTGTVYISSVLYYSLDTDHRNYLASSGLEVRLY